MAYESVPENILSVRSLSTQFIELILDTAEEMKMLVRSRGGDESLKHRILATVFYEASTRTSCSFQAAMLRLGGSVITVNSGDSSVKKGESLEDTIQAMSSYSDIIALRHPDKGSAVRASRVSSKPVINAGDGIGEHPTQALLDLYTIKSELGRIEGPSAREKLVVVLLGDLKNGRTVHSLVVLLSMFSNLKLIYCAPKGLEMPSYIVQELDMLGGFIDQVHDMSLDEAIEIADVLYVTRIQRERFASEADYQAVLGSYCVNSALMAKAKQHMVVMHPLPRVNEIDTAVDSDPRAAYFRQMENGMFVRMALLQCMVLKSADQVRSNSDNTTPEKLM